MKIRGTKAAAVGITGLLTTAEVTCDVVEAAWWKVSRVYRHNYWETRAEQLEPTIIACPDCTATEIDLGIRWSALSSFESGKEIGANQRYCATHSPIMKKIHMGWARTRKRG